MFIAFQKRLDYLPWLGLFSTLYEEVLPRALRKNSSYARVVKLADTHV
jgi:hypothetical protein